MIEVALHFHATKSPTLIIWSQFLTWKSVQTLWVMHFAPLLIPTLSAQPPLPTSWRHATLEPLHPFGIFGHPTFTRTWPSTCWGIKPNFTSWPSKDIRNHPMVWRGILTPRLPKVLLVLLWNSDIPIPGRIISSKITNKQQINRNPSSNSQTNFFLGQSKKNLHDCWYLLRSDHFRHPCFIPLGLRV